MTEALSTASEPLLHWNVPGLGGEESVEISAHAGRALVIVGANGSGKSALSHWLSVNRGAFSAPIVRVLAHRRLWLKSAGTEMTASQRLQMGDAFASWDSNPVSRVMVEGDSERASKVLYDLLGMVNGRNARIAELVDTHQELLSVEESILTTMGRIFAAANLAITFRVTDLGTFDAVAKSGATYPVSEMSDGEKGAFLLAAETLLSPRGSVQIVDEPERHLHRAVSSDFIAALMRERPDCAFVLLTHDLDLIGRLEPANTTVCTVRAVSWDNGRPNGWDLVIDPASSEVPDSVRQAILGGRTRLLFVEGQTSSLDHSLYRLIWPSWTVVPCGGADDVKKATGGLVRADDYHWVDGRGVLDGDSRSTEEISELAAKKILVLPVNEVENLYYQSWLVDALADQQAAALDLAAAALKAAAREKALEALSDDTIKHLAAVNAVKILRSQALALLPSGAEMIAGGVALPVDLASPYPDQRDKLVSRVAAGDYDAVVREYSVRDSGFLTAVARALGFQSRDHYENAARVLLRNDSLLMARLRDVVGELPG